MIKLVDEWKLHFSEWPTGAWLQIGPVQIVFYRNKRLW